MGVRNYLIEGVSGTGKSSVCEELRARGFQAIDGDKELAYQGDPDTGEPTQGFVHQHHIWDISKVKKIVENHDEEITFLCGGSRNFYKFINLFNKVFVLDVDEETLNRRLDNRPENAWGKNPNERKLILRLHETKEDIPKNAIVIDATVPLDEVVNDIVRQVAG